MEGVRYGFRVGFDYQTPIVSAQHIMPSARERPGVVSDYLRQREAGGRRPKSAAKAEFRGPLEPAMFPQVHTSRFRVIPKGSSGKLCLILDMSSPEGRLVNDGISEALCSLTYVGVRVEDAVKGIKERGKGALLAKVDIKSAEESITPIELLPIIIACGIYFASNHKIKEFFLAKEEPQSPNSQELQEASSQELQDKQEKDKWLSVLNSIYTTTWQRGSHQDIYPWAV